MKLEDALTESLTRNAGHAPAPPADISRRVAAGHRRRRITRVTSAVTGTALAVAALTVGVQQLRPDHRDPSLGAPTSTVTATSVPIAKQWPGAVRTIPNTLADGTPFHPIDYIDDKTILIRVPRSGDTTKYLLTYDLATGRTTKLGFPVPHSDSPMIEDVTIGSGRVALQTRTKEVTEIWTAPLSGGPATKIATEPVSPTDGVFGLTLADGSAYWSLTRGGVYRVPVTGGTAELLPGTEKQALLSWPWVGGPRWDDGGSALAKDAPVQVAYKDIRNLVTGERRSSAIGGSGRWTCSITWCVSEEEARSRDGRRVVQPMSDTTYQGAGWGPALDRFVIMNLSGMDDVLGTTTLVDLETGKGGAFPPHRKAGIALRDTRLTYQEYAKTYLLIDLAKIS